jgi:hypothetical protein
VKKGTLDIQVDLQKEWVTKYIRLIRLVINRKSKIHIFDDYGLFISQNTDFYNKDGVDFILYFIVTQLNLFLVCKLVDIFFSFILFYFII